MEGFDIIPCMTYMESSSCALSSEEPYSSLLIVQLQPLQHLDFIPFSHAGLVCIQQSYSYTGKFYDTYPRCLGRRETVYAIVVDGGFDERS